MSSIWRFVLSTTLALTWATVARAGPVTYWNLFNFEGESSVNANYVTYGSLGDMLNDTNRTGVFVPDVTGNAARNIVGSGSDGSTYWSLFNFEGESSISAAYATYGSPMDMLNDTARTGIFLPSGTGNARNVVGSGSDGDTYWNLFNPEEEANINATYATYGSLMDMLNDTNRTGVFVPNASGNAARNVVGSGSDGNTYWNLFNFEGESSINAAYVTYGSLMDMLNDSNRIEIFIPNVTGNAARNVVGSGASVSIAPMPIPTLPTVWLMAAGLVGATLGSSRRDYPFLHNR